MQATTLRNEHARRLNASETAAKGIGTLYGLRGIVDNHSVWKRSQYGLRRHGQLTPCPPGWQADLQWRSATGRDAPRVAYCGTKPLALMMRDQVWL